MDAKDKNNGLTKGLAAIGGLVDIVGNTGAIMKLGNVNGIREDIQDLEELGKGYSSYDDISRGYSQLAIQPDISYRTVRGSSEAEQYGNILSSTLTGATSGSVFGVPGAIIGGLVGLGAGVGGKIIGDTSADNIQKNLQLSNYIANSHGRMNLAAASEKAADMAHRNMIGNMKAEGGKMRTLTIKDFAEKVLRNQKRNSVSHSGGIVINKCDGGTMIRIKR